MIRVFVVYVQMPDSDRDEQHVELCRKVPGAIFRHGPVTRTLQGEPLEYYAEFEFVDSDAFKSAMSSDEFKAAGGDAAEMGKPHRIYIAEIE
jgi:hypothetical protein